MSYTPLPPVPEEFKVLSMMNNIGAVSPERSLSPDELSQWTEIDLSTIKAHLQKLRENGYVELVEVSGTQKYHLTRVGIMKVLTLYS